MSSTGEGGTSEARATDVQAGAIRNESGLLTKRTVLVITAGSAVIVLLLMVWQAARFTAGFPEPVIGSFSANPGALHQPPCAIVRGA
jgi:hypothetical protein